MEKTLSIDVKGPYRVSHMVIGDYKYFTIEGKEVDRICKGTNLVGDKNLTDIVALFTFGATYDSDELLKKGNLLIPTVPTLEALNIKESDLGTKEVHDIFCNIISPFYNLNKLHNSELSLAMTIGNIYNKYVVREFKKQPSVVKFNNLDIENLYDIDKEISTYYPKAYLDKVYESCKTDLDEDCEYSICITKPILSKAIGNVHEIKKMLITLYTPDTNPVCIILSFKELDESDMESLNRTRMFSHDII